MTPVTLITADRLDVMTLVRLVGADNTGAITTFLGLVRDHNQGRRVSHLIYEAYEPLADRALSRIIDEARDQWSSATLALHHRIGRLEIGEASVAIAAASPHRADAFAACRYAIERVKQIVPIWKHEYFEGGDVWIEGATADPEDTVARERDEDRVHITVRFFARLRELVGAGELERDVPAGATVRTVWDGLVRDYPAIAAYTASISCAVNVDYARMTTAVSDGDEVAFLPPVSGG